MHISLSQIKLYIMRMHADMYAATRPHWIRNDVF
jgi:hypothetical protein